MFHLKALGKNRSVAVPASDGLRFSQTCGSLGPISVYFTWSSSLSESESSPPFSSIKTLIVGFRTHPKPVKLHLN